MGLLLEWSHACTCKRLQKNNPINWCYYCETSMNKWFWLQLYFILICNRVHTETGKENSMSFPWLLVQFHDLKIDIKCQTGENNKWNAPRFWCLMQSFLFIFIFQPSAKNNSMTIIFHDQNKFFHEFSRARMQISNSMTFHDLSTTVSINPVQVFVNVINFTSLNRYIF